MKTKVEMKLLEKKFRVQLQRVCFPSNRNSILTDGCLLTH